MTFEEALFEEWLDRYTKLKLGFGAEDLPMSERKFAWAAWQAGRRALEDEIEGSEK